MKKSEYSAIIKISGDDNLMFQLAGAPNGMPTMYPLEFYDNFIICRTMSDNIDTIRRIVEKIYNGSVENVTIEKWKISINTDISLIKDKKAARNFSIPTDLFQYVYGSKYAVEYLKNIQPDIQVELVN